MISADSPWDQPTQFGLEVRTDPEHGTAMLRCVFSQKGRIEHKGWTEIFSGPFTAEDLLYAARVLRQAARNIDPEFKLVVIE